MNNLTRISVVLMLVLMSASPAKADVYVQTFKCQDEQKQFSANILAELKSYSSLLTMVFSAPTSQWLDFEGGFLTYQKAGASNLAGASDEVTYQLKADPEKRTLQVRVRVTAMEKPIFEVEGTLDAQGEGEITGHVVDPGQRPVTCASTPWF